MSDLSSAAAPRRLFPVFRTVFGLSAACFIGGLATDIVYATSPDMQWSNFSMWLITVGLVVAAAAAAVGIVDLLITRPAGWLRRGWALPIGAAAASIVSVFNDFVHSRDAYESVVPTGLTRSASPIYGWSAKNISLRPFLGALTTFGVTS